ncbi:MAG: Ig-like domain-containing protein, partial [Betaproteobacteria bacterium]
TDTGTLTITVAAVNDAPVAVDDTVTTRQDKSIVIAVLTNDVHADSSTMSIVTVTSPSNGSVAQDGSLVTYTPDSGFSGSDTFSYTVQDANGVTDTGTVTVTVNATATACSPTISALGNDCTITPTNHKMNVLAFGLCTSAPIRPTTTSNYNISSCQLIYDGRSVGGTQVSVAGGGTQSFAGNLTIPPYGTYTHGIMLIDNSFTVQGELVLDASAANRYCYIEAGMTVTCYATQQTPSDVTDTVGNFFNLSPAIYSYSFSDDNVTVDLVTNESAASTLSSSDAASDAILAIQTLGSPTTFNESTRALDIGIKISEAVVIGSGGADTSPFSIQFSVE